MQIIMTCKLAITTEAWNIQLLRSETRLWLRLLLSHKNKGSRKMIMKVILSYQRSTQQRTQGTGPFCKWFITLTWKFSLFQLAPSANWFRTVFQRTYLPFMYRRLSIRFQIQISIRESGNVNQFKPSWEFQIIRTTCGFQKENIW